MCRKQFFESAVVTEHQQITDDIYRLEVQAPHIDKGHISDPGQFYMLGLKDRSHILPRPLSVHAFFPETARLVFLYRVTGAGTQELTSLQTGDTISVQGPLGNGFTVPDNPNLIIAVGGGIGLAPLYQLLRVINDTHPAARLILIAGGRNKTIEPVIRLFSDTLPATVKVCTDDGSLGIKGFVPDMLSAVLQEECTASVSMVYTCGPRIMMEKVIGLTAKYAVPCQVSLERRMACGIRACMGCSIQTDKGIRKVCSDGPVFDAGIFFKRGHIE